MEKLYEELLGLSGLKVKDVRFETASIHIYCYFPSSGICPVCQKAHSTINQYYERVIRDLPMSGHKVYLHLKVSQYKCAGCGRTHSQLFDFVEPGKSYTKRQAKWVIELSRKQPYSEVAAQVDCSSKTVERIVYSGAKVEKTKAAWAKIRRIGIDEFSFRKGHKDYIVTLIDLDTHEIIDILPNRDKASLIAYFEGLGKSFCQQIRCFSSDMWGPFLSLAEAVFPNADRVIDRFHWTKHLNDALDRYRKILRTQDYKTTAYKTLKWKLIKRTEHLTGDEFARLGISFSSQS